MFLHDPGCRLDTAVQGHFLKYTLLQLSPTPISFPLYPNKSSFPGKPLMFLRRAPTCSQSDFLVISSPVYKLLPAGVRCLIWSQRQNSHNLAQVLNNQVKFPHDSAKYVLLWLQNQKGSAHYWVPSFIRLLSKTDKTDQTCQTCFTSTWVSFTKLSLTQLKVTGRWNPPKKPNSQLLRTRTQNPHLELQRTQ